MTSASAADVFRALAEQLSQVINMCKRLHVTDRQLRTEMPSRDCCRLGGARLERLVGLCIASEVVAVLKLS